MNEKNRDNLIKYINMALSNAEYLSYAEIVNFIEKDLNISLDCYDSSIAAVKNVILDYGIYRDGKKPKRFRGTILFIANEKKDSRQNNQIKWKKI